MRLRTIAFILVAFSGCSSITSTPISRTDENSFYGDTNGKPKLFGRTRAFKGTPVKLKVQTHVDV